MKDAHKQQHISALQDLIDRKKQTTEQRKNITEEEKHAIYETLSPKLQARLQENEKQIIADPDLQRKVRRDLARTQLSTLLLEQEDATYAEKAQELEQKKEAAMDEQKRLQDQGILAGKVVPIGRFTAHTKIDELVDRTGSLAYKAQLSRSPLDYLVINGEDTQPGDLIKYSIYQPEKIPPQLLDFAATGTRQRKYNKTKKLWLTNWWLDHINDVFKSMLQEARPLKLQDKTKTRPARKPSTTQRIVQIKHTASWVPNIAYLISEHTPRIHAEKNLRKRKTADIRYTLLPSLKHVEQHLHGQVEAAQKKITQRQQLAQMLPSRDEFINDHDIYHQTLDMLKKRHQSTWYTEADLDIHDKISRLLSLSDKQKSAQRVIIQAISNILVKSQEERRYMISHLQEHQQKITEARETREENSQDSTHFSCNT